MHTFRTSGSASSSARARSRGFTLVELLTVLTILGIVAAMAAPSMRQFSAGQAAKALAFDITADLLLARSEALKRNASVSISPSGESWERGWTVTSGTENISRRNALAATVIFSDAPSAITFDVNGRVSAPNSPVRMTITPQGGGSRSAKRCIELDLSGRARSRVGECA